MSIALRAISDFQSREKLMAEKHIPYHWRTNQVKRKGLNGEPIKSIFYTFTVEIFAPRDQFLPEKKAAFSRAQEQLFSNLNLNNAISDFQSREKHMAAWVSEQS